ncbi:hypothetical protein SAMN05518672_101560 [Chitinophaga sp. CF118]|nr:hypothetical protein SAMN05518672_101560 [Chitinophaga sp. CF118]
MNLTAPDQGFEGNYSQSTSQIIGYQYTKRYVYCISNVLKKCEFLFGRSEIQPECKESEHKIGNPDRQ